MKNVKLSRIIFVVFVLLFVVTNTYFGWNFKPQSELEKQIDLILIWVLRLSLIIYFLPLFKIYESAVKKNDNSKIVKKTCINCTHYFAHDGVFTPCEGCNENYDKHKPYNK